MHNSFPRMVTLDCGTVIEVTEKGWRPLSSKGPAQPVVRQKPVHVAADSIHLIQQSGVAVQNSEGERPSSASSGLVTCLCLTKNRREWLPTAIACFERQTYPNRELLIVADFPGDVEGLIPPDERIRVMFTGSAVVGRKRNLGCEQARGEFVAIWDDDDFSAPGRLADQVPRLEKSGRAVTGYHSMKFTDGKSWWLYPGPKVGFVLATSMLFRRDWWLMHRFQEIQRDQDEMFGTQAASRKQLEVAGDLDLMYATCHPKNTSPRNMKAHMWQRLPEYRWA